MTRRPTTKTLRTGVAVAAATAALFGAATAATTAATANESASSASNDVSASGLNLGFKVVNNTGVMLRKVSALSSETGWGNTPPADFISDVRPGYFEVARPAKDHKDLRLQNYVTYDIVNPTTNVVEGQVTMKPDVTFSHDYFTGWITVSSENSSCSVTGTTKFECNVPQRMAKQKQQTVFSIDRA